MSDLIELRGASKDYGPTAALHPTDLAFETGKVTALLGASGCGKTTILRLIIGSVLATRGRVLFDGAVVGADNGLMLRRRMGYVIQDGGLFPHMTAENNVLVLADHLKVPRSEGRARFAELCELTMFPAGATKHYPDQLSGGQRQRVGLMRALMLKPEVLLLDEPLGALDPLVRAALQTDLKRICAELKQTVVLVTHDLGEAAYLADRIVLMQSGRVVQQGTLADLRVRPATPYITEFLHAQRSLAAF